MIERIGLSGNRLRVLALIFLIGLKVIYAAITPFSLDLFAWIRMGSGILSGTLFQGVYTAPAYIYAGTYALWLLATKDATALNRVIESYSPYTPGPRIVIIPIDQFVFTLFMKIPMLVADIATMFALSIITTKLTGSSRKGMVAALLWASSPLVFLAEMINTVEVFPALLILLGVYSIHQSKLKSGSLFLAIGSILRLAPLLFSWIYLIAFLRLRQIKNLVTFVVIHLALFASGLFLASYVAGVSPVQVAEDLLSGRPGVLVSEVLSSLGLFITPRIGYNPYGLGANLTLYVLIGYLLTKQAAWKNRSIGAEALILLAGYFALTSYSPQFLLWMVPIFIVYSVVTRFGSKYFLLTSWLGFVMIAVLESQYLSGYQKAVFLIPTMNAVMVSLSVALYRLYSLVMIPILVRSLFSAFLLFLILWIVREMIQSSRQSNVSMSPEPSAIAQER